MEQRPDSPWSSHHLAADQAIQQLNFQEVDRLLGQALTQVGKQPSTGTDSPLRQLIALFDVCIEQMRSQQRALFLATRRTETFPDNHRMRGLALLAVEWGRLDAYDCLLAAQEAEYGAEHLAVADTLLVMERHTWEVNEIKALPLAERALAIRETQLGKEHRDTLQVVETLARGYSILIMYEQAAPLWERYAASLRKQQGANEEWATNYRDTLVQLGKAYNALRNHEQAADVWQRFLTQIDLAQLRREGRERWSEFYKRFGKEGSPADLERGAESHAFLSSNVLDGYSGAGRAHLALGHWSEAEHFLCEAVQVHQRHPDHTIIESNGIADLELGATQHDYARALRGLGRTEEALPYFKRALGNITRRERGPLLASRSRIPALLTEYAAALRDTGSPEAMEMQRRADAAQAEWDEWLAEIARRNARRRQYRPPQQGNY